jgi:hypothetical protein
MNGVMDLQITTFCFHQPDESLPTEDGSIKTRINRYEKTILVLFLYHII